MGKAREKSANHYGKHICGVCKKEISNNGLAYFSHNRMHVRRGEMEEIKSLPGSIFSFSEFRIIKKEETPNAT